MYHNIILYIIIFIISIIILFSAYIKIKFRFWTLQPVFHIYDFYYYLLSPRVIDAELPEKNKYCNFKDIETITYNSLSELQINQFIRFICSNYLKNKDNCYLPKKNNILPYFEGHTTLSFFSFYYENEFLMDLKKGTTISNKRVIGVMTSRPLIVFINKNNLQINVYYVDHLCVDCIHRKKGIAPQIIQTHHYNQRNNNKKIKVSLFKREDNLTGIIPLCVYNTYGFSMTKWNKPQELTPNISLIECGKTNMHFFLDFIKQNIQKFNIFIQPEISNIFELIKSNNIFIYMIICNDNVECVYFFRKTCTSIFKNCEAISCFASINNLKNKNTFVMGFKNALWKISQQNNFKFLIIEDISHNIDIIQNLMIKSIPIITSPTAYFFYNYIYHTEKSNNVFIIH